MLTRFKGRDTIKCHAKARVVVARKLAVVMHAMRRDGTFHVGDPTASAQDVAARATAKEKRLSYAQS
jgi:transposase